MQFHQTCRVPLPREKAYNFLLDVPQVASCLPGVEKVEPIGDDTYQGTVKVGVGFIKVALTGNMKIIEKDPANFRAVMAGEGADKKIGGAVNVKMSMQLNEISENESELVIDTDAQVMGRLGEFGQSVMRKKADSMMAEFAKNLAKKAQSGAIA